MKTLQSVWDGKHWQDAEEIKQLNSDNTLVLLFGSINNENHAIQQLRNYLPDAQLTGCSTAGEVSGVRVHDNALVVTVICFEKTPYVCCV